MNINNKPCPCHSGIKYKKCCRPFHTGAQQVEAPEQLLRSRYSAYAIGEANYIMATTHPDHEEAQKPEPQWRQELGLFARHTTFTSLDIQQQSYTPGEDTGWIVFAAGLEQNGQNASFREKSIFERIDGTWLYASAEELEDLPE